MTDALIFDDPCEYWECKWLNTKLKYGHCIGDRPWMDCYADMKADQRNGMTARKIQIEGKAALQRRGRPHE